MTIAATRKNRGNILEAVIKVVVVLLVVVLAVPAALFFLSTHSTLAFDPAPKAIGEATPVSVRIANPHGVRRVTAMVEQGDQRTVLSETDATANRLTFWRSHVEPREFHFATAKGIKEGKARLIVEAESNDLRGSTDSVSADVDVILRPPSLAVDGFQHYINQGGSEMAILTPSGGWTEAGVRVGNDSFRSFPLPGGKERIALFAFSWDMPRTTAPVAFVKNAAGTQATAHFWFKVFPKKFRKRDLPIDDAFLNKVVNQIDPNGSGDLLPRFLKINGEMRRENNKTLADLRFKTEEKFLWSQPFLQMANSKVESSFADVRSYIYKGQKVDQQTHLGFDLAVSQHTPVLAANDGKVVWAAPLGIYGNCIVVDHGYSLQSIYGHLSEISVKEGQMVKRGEAMGRSGSTGLAGGDHLHFSMQIEGVEVNPIEWWDEHWIKDHVFARLNGSANELTPRP
jgi:murein DD-endopeptidase MepM/ murein hydrolase activator NlpD